jgi:hypothetical protein
VSARDGGLLVHVMGNSFADARLGASLGSSLPLIRVATRRLREVATRDGAPLVGWLKMPKLFVIAGLGNAGAFYVPGLARVIAGQPSREEKAWFAARDPAHAAVRGGVAEYAPGEFA